MTRCGHHKMIPLAILALCIVCTQQHRVVIIGAGAAGLAAATRLLEHNVTDIKILEAEGRIGGRVNSVPFGEAIVELGAEWCHGQVENVIYEMVKDLDLLEDPGEGINIVFSNGKSLDNNKSMSILQALEKLYEEPDESYANSTSAEFISAAFPEALKKQFEDDEETLKLALQSMPLYEHYILSLESAFSWDDIAIQSAFEDCEGQFNLAWKGKGYNQIFDIMAKKIPKSAGPPLPIKDKIHFNKLVSKIDYSGSKPIVTCTDGSEYTSDYVLFTPSVGVLKHCHKELFHPSLPQEKVSAIEDVGFGAVIKIIQSYSEIWWPTDLNFGISFSWTKEDNDDAAKVFADGPMKDGKSWVCSIYTIVPAEHNPHVMYIWLTGPFVPDVEQLSNSDLDEGISYVFNKFLGNKYNISKPDKMIRYGWYSNPNFRGTYSYDTLKSKRSGESCREILAKPEKNADGKEVLLFAGEVTNSNHYSTVHGAIETGYREADRILSSN